MKVQSTGNHSKLRAGVSPLEMLIALSVFTVSTSAALLVSFGSQSILTDTQTNNEALAKSHTDLENLRALSRQDFSSIISSATTTDGIYSKTIAVTDLTPCSKQVVSTITWNAEKLRHVSIKL